MRFNANEVQPAAAYGPLPNGVYRVRVTDANEIENKNRNGKYLELVLLVLEGEHKGRKLWCRYTSEHENEQAASIGRGQISQALRALGKPVINHEVELQDCIADVRVGREKRDPERNEVKEWLAAAGQQGAATYSAIHQRAGANEYDIHRQGGQLRQATQAAASATRQPLPPANVPAFIDDEDVPF